MRKLQEAPLSSLFSSSSLDDGDDSKKSVPGVESTERHDGVKHGNKLPQVRCPMIASHLKGSIEINTTLTQDFSVKYLGMKPARGLWGIKHTRKPVDDLVGLARGLGPGAPLPFLQLTVSARGVVLSADKANTCPTPDTGLYPIDTISYGVQDLVYTRVFAMIVVRDKARDKDKEAADPGNPFQCLAFVCDSRQTARRLTFALAAAFKVIDN